MQQVSPLYGKKFGRDHRVHEPLRIVSAGGLWQWLHFPQNLIDNIILPRWRNDIAGEMKPLAIRNWLYDLHDDGDYHWETCSKAAGIMSLAFDFVDHNEIYSIRNPMDKVTISASEEEHPEIRLLSPDEVFSLIERLP